MPFVDVDFHVNQDSNSPWAKEGSRWVCKVVGCPTTYSATSLLVRHLAKDHDMLVRPSRSNHPSIWPKGLCQQDHAYMDKRILGNPLAHFCRNEQKAINQSKHKAISEWDHLQAKALQHLELSKLTFVIMASNWFFWLFGIPNWGDGSIHGYWILLVERDDGLAKFIHGSKTSYAKAIQAAWDSHPRNSPIKSSTNK